MAGNVYIVTDGDTLAKIADKFNVDFEELALRNGIKDPDVIHVGQKISIRDAQDIHLVKRNETLSTIAAASNVTVEAILAANPAIRNRNLIFLGQRIVIPPAAGPATPGLPAAVPASAVPAAPALPAVPGPVDQVGRLSLTATDIVNIKKTLQTEWVQSAGDDQAKGIVDTILNRLSSGHWGSSIADVVNARNQFSDINGPISRADGRHTVDEIDMSRVSKRVRDLVDAYLAARAAGTPSRIGSHLNYANPHFSSARNLPWIMALDGPILGKGNAIHRHGTVPELDRFRPDPFQLAQSRGTGGSGAALASTPPDTGVIDGDRVAADNGVGVKSDVVKIANLHPAMEAIIKAVARATGELGLPRAVITSGNDSKHGKNSLHYANRALDFRGRDITVTQGNALDSAVTAILGPKYDVIFETFLDSNNNHLHVEYDPR